MVGVAGNDAIVPVDASALSDTTPDESLRLNEGVASRSKKPADAATWVDASGICT